MVILELKAITVKRYLVNELISIINDYVLNDPAKFPELWQFEGVAARFSSKKYPNESYNDNATVIALACAEAVVIRIIGEKS